MVGKRECESRSFFWCVKQIVKNWRAPFARPRTRIRTTEPLMPANLPRGTPGLLLLVFAIAMVLIALWGWVQRAPHTPPRNHESHSKAAAL